MEARIEIASGEYRLVAAPSRGGSILAFTWRGQNLLRETAGPSILDAACFPLVPYSNRIAAGRFSWQGRPVTLAANFPDVDPANPLHGFGWLSAWTILDATGEVIELEHLYPGGEWPWPYRARLSYMLSPNGLRTRLELSNLAREPMPAGLGLHPYIPRNNSTCYLGLHSGEWQGDAEGLPIRLDRHDHAVDWWDGLPVSARQVDTVYAGREGSLGVYWPDRDLMLQLHCSDDLSLTSVFAPSGADWFCIEPVSHMTDALNRAGTDGAMAILQPGDTFAVEILLQASALGESYRPKVARSATSLAG